MPSGPLPCKGSNLLSFVLLLACTTAFTAAVIYNDWSTYNYDDAAVNPYTGEPITTANNSTRVANYYFHEGLWRVCEQECLLQPLQPTDPMGSGWTNGCADEVCYKKDTSSASQNLRACRGFAIATVVLSFFAFVCQLLGCWESDRKPMPTIKLAGFLAILTGFFALITWAIYIGDIDKLNTDDWENSYLKYGSGTGAFVGGTVFAWVAGCLSLHAYRQDQDQSPQPIPQQAP